MGRLLSGCMLCGIVDGCGVSGRTSSDSAMSIGAPRREPAAWRRGVAASRCNDARRARAQLAACGARECTTRRVQPNKRSRREQTAAQEASRGASGRMERAEADALPGTLSVQRSQALPLRVNSRSVGTRTWVRGQRSQEGSCCEDGGGACPKGSLGVDHPWNRGHACMAFNQGPSSRVAAQCASDSSSQTERRAALH